MIDEQGVDQVIDGQMGFANQVAKPGMAAEPAGPMQGITGGGLEGHRAIPRGSTGVMIGARRARPPPERMAAIRAMGSGATMVRRDEHQCRRVCGSGDDVGNGRISLPLAS